MLPQNVSVKILEYLLLHPSGPVFYPPCPLRNTFYPNKFSDKSSIRSLVNNSPRRTSLSMTSTNKTHHLTPSSSKGQGFMGAPQQKQEDILIPFPVPLSPVYLRKHVLITPSQLNQILISSPSSSLFFILFCNKK